MDTRHCNAGSTHRRAHRFPLGVLAVLLAAVPVSALTAGRFYSNATLFQVAGDSLLIVQASDPAVSLDRIKIYRAVSAGPGPRAASQPENWDLIIDDMQGRYYGAVRHGSEVFLMFDNTLGIVYRETGGGPWRWRSVTTGQRFIPETGVSDGKRLFFFGKHTLSGELAGAMYQDGEIRALPESKIKIDAEQFQLISAPTDDGILIIWRPQTRDATHGGAYAFTETPVAVTLDADGNYSSPTEIQLKQEGMLGLWHSPKTGDLMLGVNPTRAGSATGFMAGVLIKTKQNTWNVQLNTYTIDYGKIPIADRARLLGLQTAVIDKIPFLVRAMTQQIDLVRLKPGAFSGTAIPCRGIRPLRASGVIWQLLILIGTMSLLILLIWFHRTRRHASRRENIPPE